ncbi:MAG: hypothetical protein M1837_001210 [Sclerophora amabilis]|nr:MAG: hypothetical protein M1837_001210 [Sclerophora amabilis]
MPSISSPSAYFFFFTLLCLTNLTYGLEVISRTNEHAVTVPLSNREVGSVLQPRVNDPRNFKSWRELNDPPYTQEPIKDRILLVQAVYTAQRWVQQLDIKQVGTVSEAFHLDDKDSTIQIQLIYRNLRKDASAESDPAPIFDPQKPGDPLNWFNRIAPINGAHMTGALICGDWIMHDTSEMQGQFLTQTSSLEPMYLLGYVIGRDLVPTTEALAKIPTPSQSKRLGIAFLWIVFSRFAASPVFLLSYSGAFGFDDFSPATQAAARLPLAAGFGLDDPAQKIIPPSFTLLAGQFDFRETEHLYFDLLSHTIKRSLGGAQFEIGQCSQIEQTEGPDQISKLNALSPTKSSPQNIDQRTRNTLLARVQDLW